MSISVRLLDGLVNIAGRIYRNNALKAAVVDAPANQKVAQELQQNLPYTTKFANAAGDVDLNVDGSATPVIFRTQAVNDRIVTITEMRFLIHSSNLDITGNDARRFGAATAASTPLPNGLTFTFRNSVRVDLFVDPVTVLGDFYTYSGQNGGGVGINASIISDVAAISPSVDYFLAVYQLTFPIVLFPDTQDRIDLTVQDDLTPLNFFQLFAYGKQELLEPT